MRYLFILLVCTSLTSCFLFKKYEQTNFSYTSGNQSFNIPVVVPKGYMNFGDSTGEQKSFRVYHYPGGATLYIAHLDNAIKSFQPIEKENNIPHVHPLGGLVFKGAEKDLRFWREIQRKNFRFGYTNVTATNEHLFDSATNFMSLQKIQ